MENGEKNIGILLKSMQPRLNEGEYVFCSVNKNLKLDLTKVVGLFTEEEGITVVVEKQVADEMNLSYASVFAWITLTVHSSLDAVGLTAAFSTALSGAGISCNVIAAFYHDHIFVAVKDRFKAVEVLTRLSQQ